MVIIMKKDEVTVLVFALRYALPRKTYAPKLVTDYIVEQIPRMTKEQREELAAELYRLKDEYADRYAEECANNLSWHLRNCKYEETEE